MNIEPAPGTTPPRRHRSDRFLATLEPYRRIVLASHVNPDPDALASMLGLEALILAKLPAKSVVVTVDGLIARAENRAMVDLIPIPVAPVEHIQFDDETALVMVDTQPHTGRRGSEVTTPVAVLDHHETGGDLGGVAFHDIRPMVGATSTMVTGYLLEQNIVVSPRVATALLYGIDSETSGYPREACPSDDGALVWLFPRSDKDLLAQIRNPKLPQSHFATFEHALVNAFLYQDVVISWCGQVSQPDIIGELADFFVRFEQVHWAIVIGEFEQLLKISARVAHLGGHSGEILREVVNGLGTAGGHDKRAGGTIPLPDRDPDTIDDLLTTIRERLLRQLKIDDRPGRRLIEPCPKIDAP